MEIQRFTAVIPLGGAKPLITFHPMQYCGIEAKKAAHVWPFLRIQGKRCVFFCSLAGGLMSTAEAKPPAAFTQGGF